MNVPLTLAINKHLRSNDCVLGLFVLGLFCLCTRSLLPITLAINKHLRSNDCSIMGRVCVKRDLVLTCQKRPSTCPATTARSRAVYY